MPAYYSYDNTIRGTQSTVNGNSFAYNVAPSNGSTWQWSGSSFTHTVYEQDPNATFYNGDPDNEQTQATMRVGQAGEQSVMIDGTARAVVYDYTFRVSDGTNTYDVAVIDVDLNNDGDLNDSGEDGYYLLFLGTPPPPNTPLTSQGIVDNSDNRTHASMGGQPVCFVAGTRIKTIKGMRPIETLTPGDMIYTCDDGYQPLRWLGTREITGLGNFAPILIKKNALGNCRDLWVSPQHRMLISDWRAELWSGEPEVLVAAKRLINDTSIIQKPVLRVIYCHMLFDRHQIVMAEGCASESLHPGRQALMGLSEESRSELFELFPELALELNNPPLSDRQTARPVIRGALADMMGHQAS
ncbi:Hint domain-containing protein [Roseovarius sp. Pro17]|uniref:Hint domain-containing protein n=1 Tax=Roseovarius sp. Pro17 TaxID=3108175 RepID=UPI002D7797E5|nr:Hint domain-containing protein [Roseovarius sp. Pro17]